jgi:coatomer subunit gamma
MVYMVIKDFIPSSDEVIIITSSLMKDTNSPNDLYRANAIRVLCRIIDPQMLLQIERYLKQAVVDKSAIVASSVLAAAIQLVPHNSEVIKRWVGEIQEAITSKHPMVQFHAVALAHALRASDRLAINKLVSQLIRSNVRSPMAQCLLVRYVAQVMAESGAPAAGEARPFYDFLESCLRNKSEIVIFEAARAIVNMREVSIRELTPAVTVLQLFLSSGKPVLRFAAVRTLNRVAMTHPQAVANAAIDMEALIGDPNRSIATLAITTLLKIGNEASIDRLLKQISGFMGEIADDFKIVVVEAIRALCVKFPAKHRGLMAFLAGVLREDGGFAYKKAIVDAMLAIISDIPDAKENGMAHLCEFIEDCEFTHLSTQILHVLGQEGPTTSDPARYIRYMYNRVILENATVRAAALSALAHFGAKCEDLRPRVLILIKRALFDNDDEVRDRATLAVHQLEGAEPRTVGPRWRPAPKGLESALKEYLELGDADVPFDPDTVPVALPQTPKAKKAKPAGLAAAVSAGMGAAGLGGGGYGGAAAPGSDEYAAMLKAVPQLASLGPILKSCPAVQLTEDETEYKVVCVRHILPEHMVLQFHCTNTVAEQVLEDVSVAVDLGDADGYNEVATVPLPIMPRDTPGQTYVALSRPAGLSSASLPCTLSFKVKEIDPSSGEAEEEGFDDEYQLEDVDITSSDFITPVVPQEGFRAVWEELGEESELVDDYGIGQREGLQEAVEALQGIMGMATCEGSDVVPPNARSHTLMLAGKVVSDVPVVVRLAFGIDPSKNVAMKLAVRSGSVEVSEAIHQIIQEA